MEHVVSLTAFSIHLAPGLAARDSVLPDILVPSLHLRERYLLEENSHESDNARTGRTMVSYVFQAKVWGIVDE